MAWNKLPYLELYHEAFLYLIRASESSESTAMNFSIALPPAFTGLFYIETGTGIIRNRVGLLGKAREQPYRLTVQAQDGGSPAHTSTVMVNMFITNIQSNKGKPVITDPPVDITYVIPEVQFFCLISPT